MTTIEAKRALVAMPLSAYQNLPDVYGRLARQRILKKAVAAVERADVSKCKDWCDVWQAVLPFIARYEKRLVLTPEQVSRIFQKCEAYGFPSPEWWECAIMGALEHDKGGAPIGYVMTGMNLGPYGVLCAENGETYALFLQIGDFPLLCRALNN